MLKSCKNNIKHNINKYICSLLTLSLLSGCGLPQKLARIGESPQIAQIQNPHQIPGYQPINMPGPEPLPLPNKTNSLWQSGSRAFFKDQRAARVGDVLTAEIVLDRNQTMELSPSINRTSRLKTTVNEVLGRALPLQKRAARLLPSMPLLNPNDPISNWMDVTSNPTTQGTSKYSLKDKMVFNMAVMIVQILPNGNMVIQGIEEIKLINEIREIQLKGIIRREDITSNNTIKSLKIANLRISYGGRGELSDSQEVPWGQQYLNAVMPF